MSLPDITLYPQFSQYLCIKICYYLYMLAERRIRYTLKCHICGTDVLRKVMVKTPTCEDCKARQKNEWSKANYAPSERELVVYGTNEFEGYEFGNDLDKLGLSLHQEWIINKDPLALKILIKLLLKEYEEITNI